MKILFFGDIVGKIGRTGLKQVLPEMKAEFEPDFIIANGENAAHGLGINKKIHDDLHAAGIDFFTTGNHYLSKPEAEELYSNKDSIIIRPANFNNAPGVGYKIVSIGSRSVLIINLIGQVFMRDESENPFKMFDEILAKHQRHNLSGIIVDFHSEATSEVVAFGWHADGRATAVIGTHTHVPTADVKVLPNGTAYVSDVGMCGATNSIIGDLKEPLLNAFINGIKPRVDVPESGSVDIGAVLIEFDPTNGKAIKIDRVDRKTEVV